MHKHLLKYMKHRISNVFVLYFCFLSLLFLLTRVSLNIRHCYHKDGNYISLLTFNDVILIIRITFKLCRNIYRGHSYLLGF